MVYRYRILYYYRPWRGFYDDIDTPNDNNRLTTDETRETNRSSYTTRISYTVLNLNVNVRTTIFHEAFGNKNRLTRYLKEAIFVWVISSWVVYDWSANFNLWSSMCTRDVVWCQRRSSRSLYMLESRRTVYHSRYPYPTAVGARALPVVLCSAVGPKGQDPDRAEERQKWWWPWWSRRSGGYATTITPKRLEKK